MLKNGFANREWSQEIVDVGNKANRKRFSLWSRHRCFLLVLLVAAVLFVYRTHVMEMTADWRPEWWQHVATKMIPFKNAVTPNTTEFNTSTSEPTVHSTFTESVNETSSPSSSQTEVLHTMELPTTKTADATSVPTVNASVVTQLMTQSKAVLPAPIPYVSPGPYLVEYPHEYHFIINEPEKCKKQKPFVVLMVPVAPHNRAHRDTIRSTWGGESVVLGQEVRLLFLLGLHTGEGAEQIQQELLQESKEHQDLIQSNFVDCYKNLTIKTMVMLEWLDSYCSNASYAMKIDSDVFLNVHNLVSMLLGAPKINYMTGLVARGAQVLRDPKSKWFLPWEIFTEPQYPRYALGLGYILSLDLPRKLVEASRHVKAVYIEDVYLGLCMRYLRIPPTDPPNWNMFNVFPIAYNRCAYSRLIATTTYEHTDHLSVWKDFQRPGPFC